MPENSYLGNIRHRGRVQDAFADGEFYKPLEDAYQAATEYSSLVLAICAELKAKWRLNRSGVWFHVKPDEAVNLPNQGWKIHVSATPTNAAPILSDVARVAFDHGVPFKFALDPSLMRMMSSKLWARGSSGKFITLYPPTELDFRTTIEDLYKRLSKAEGPYILSDKRYRDCRVLYYRYGEFLQQKLVDLTGCPLYGLSSPNGEVILDERQPYFSPPPWVTDPFPTNGGADEEMTLNCGRYEPKAALAFSNSGGVYLANDRKTGREVIIKEARAHTMVDAHGNDAIKLRKKEYEILQSLYGSGIAPNPLDAFDDWENFYIVEEYISGTDIRTLMLTRNPLLKGNPTLEDCRSYFEVFKSVFASFAKAITLLHAKEIVLGDLSPNNVRVELPEFKVKIVDFEGAIRVGIDRPVHLYTPGFRDPERSRVAQAAFKDDLYGLAAVMLYSIFPINSISAVRADLYDRVLGQITEDIGWGDTGVFNVVKGLSIGTINCDSVGEMLGTPACFAAPRFTEDSQLLSCEEVIQELGKFILEHMCANGSKGLFPADSFMHRTNSLSLGFGACGVLYALKKCGFEIPKTATDYVANVIGGTEKDALPPGVLTGASGIAWCLCELGLEDEGIRMIKIANQSPLLRSNHSYLYGMAGIGLANIYVSRHTGDPTYLSSALSLGEELVDNCHETDAGVFWKSGEIVECGFGYGQAGVALFLLRLSQVTGEQRFAIAGGRALEFDLAQGTEIESGVLSFSRTPSERTTFEQYLEEGTAGIARVALRYGRVDNIEMMLRDVYRKYSVFPGLLSGLSGLMDVLVDSALYLHDVKWLHAAARPLSGILQLYLIKKPEGLATPGDGLFRLSCDFATGSAGVMRALHRLINLDDTDFMLDELAPLMNGAEVRAYLTGSRRWPRSTEVLTGWQRFGGTLQKALTRD